MRHHIEKSLVIGLLITVEQGADVAPTARSRNTGYR
jgi:hypothetical protein